MMQQKGSYIDLKEATIYLKEGSSGTGAVNNVSGYALGSTTILMDAYVGIVPVGSRVTFAGNTGVYYVSSTVETTGNTTTIVLESGITGTPLTDNDVITFGGVYLEIKVGEGNLTYSETKNREYKLNRGKIDKVRNGDETPVEVSTTFAWTFITAHTSETVPTVEDFLKRRGPAAAYKSTGSDCDSYSVDLVVRKAPAACTGETYPVEEIVFPQFRYEKLDHDAKAGTVSMTGKCNATEPTVTRYVA